MKQPDKNPSPKRKQKGATNKQFDDNKVREGKEDSVYTEKKANWVILMM